jgi:hypothetical protein
MISMFGKSKPTPPKPDPDVVEAMIKPEPGAILGGRKKPGR